ncbi:MAG: hypothetical protein G01um101431_206 [Parcubacteria group bacterium Gr01-1014_31]|nr:MAG: hypothetical protein G01um101431_206 [Parcubacteria group bacterium Gr01-1014_31]
MNPAVKDFLERNERRIGLGLMAMGFGIDNLTLNRIDLLFDNLIFFFYLSIALTAIFLTNAHQGGVLQTRFIARNHAWLPLPMQYAFGGLFSGFVVIYSRSGTWVASWIFLSIMAALLVGNEFAKNNYVRLAYHITIFYTALFSFAIFFLPVLTRRMGTGMFLLSGATSLATIAVILFALAKLTPAVFLRARVKAYTGIAAVFLLFNVLYFTNVIPPVPLSLKQIGVYHAVGKNPLGYSALVEPPPWHRFYEDTSRVFNRYGNEPVFVFSSVFAPTDLKAPIFHRWSFYNQQLRKWTVTDRLSFSILGGRDGGYRGYSQKRNVAPGRWRVDVVTSRGQLIGYVTFSVVTADVIPGTKRVTL